MDDLLLNDRPIALIGSILQHAVVVYSDSGDCTEALLRSELTDVEVWMESQEVAATANSRCLVVQHAVETF